MRKNRWWGRLTVMILRLSIFWEIKRLHPIFCLFVYLDVYLIILQRYVTGFASLRDWQVLFRASHSPHERMLWCINGTGSPIMAETHNSLFSFNFGNDSRSSKDIFCGIHLLGLVGLLFILNHLLLNYLLLVKDHNLAILVWCWLGNWRVSHSIHNLWGVMLMFFELFRVEKFHRTLLLRHHVHVHRPFASGQLTVPNALSQLVVITVGLAVVNLAFYLHKLVTVLDRRLGV